jgi:hypothetical protein
VSRSFEQIRREISTSYNQKPCSYFDIKSFKSSYFGLTALYFEHLYVIPVTECGLKWLVQLVQILSVICLNPYFKEGMKASKTRSIVMVYFNHMTVYIAFVTYNRPSFNSLNAGLNPICHLRALL